MVQESIYDEFVERSAERAKQRTVGDPFDAANEQVKLLQHLLPFIYLKIVTKLNDGKIGK